MSSSQKKKHPPPTSGPATASKLTSQVTQELQFPTNSQPQPQTQSHFQSPQEKQQSQNVCPWSAHAPPLGQSSSPFLRNAHALSTSATAAGELFLFGGYVHKYRAPSNGLYVLSTQDFSTTFLQTSGDVPSPRYGHRAVLTGTVLLIWGGCTNSGDQNAVNAQNPSSGDSFYLLNLVSRKWTRIAVNGPRPDSPHYHSMTLVGSKLFVFGGKSREGYLNNDIWALDLNCLKLNPSWESYEPAPGTKKPVPRAGHVSVTTGDRIIIFGGIGNRDTLNDTWSFDISTRKWTELQCTGSIPSPRSSHAAILIDDVMYVFGGHAADRTYLGDLTAFNLSTQRWTAFQGIGPSPRGRSRHAMACDGTRIFVLGGLLSPGAQADETNPIHVLDTKHLDFSKSDSDVNPSEKTTQLVRKSSVMPPTRGQPYQPLSSSSDAHAAHGASPFQKATPEGLDRPTSLQITREQNTSPNGLPSRQTGANDRARRVPEDNDGGEGSTEHHVKLADPDAPSVKEIARLKDGRLIELERKLSETLSAQTERDRQVAQLTNQLAQKSALLEQAEANAAEAKKHARLELRELQAKLNELALSRDEHLRTLEQTAIEHETELAELRAELEGKKSELEAVRSRLVDAEDNWAKSRAEADTLRAQTAAGLVNADVDRVMHRLMDRMRAMETEVSSLRGNEKSIEEMECRNEG